MYITYNKLFYNKKATPIFIINRSFLINSDTTFGSPPTAVCSLACLCGRGREGYQVKHVDGILSAMRLAM